jgi:hypothetical protein
MGSAAYAEKHFPSSIWMTQFTTILTMHSILQIGLQVPGGMNGRFLTHEHHKDFNTLRRYAGSGCKFCSLLCQALLCESYQMPRWIQMSRCQMWENCVFTRCRKDQGHISELVKSILHMGGLQSRSNLSDHLNS